MLRLSAYEASHFQTTHVFSYLARFKLVTTESINFTWDAGSLHASSST